MTVNSPSSATPGPRRALGPVLVFVLACLLCCGGCARYMQKLDIGEDEPEPPKAHEGLPEELARVMLAAGRNGPQLRAYLGGYEEGGEQARAAARVLRGLCLADAAELSAEDLAGNQARAFAAQDRAPWGQALPDDVFLDYVLAPRVGREMASPWRAELEPLLESEAGAGSVALAVAGVRVRVYAWAAYTPMRGFVLPPMGVVRRASGNATELAVLLAASLRTVGVPARLPAADGALGMVEYWDGAWKTVSVLDLSDLPRAALSRAEEERALRERSWRGEALAWLASRRDPGCPRDVARRALVEARGNWREVARFLLAVGPWRAEVYAEYLKTLRSNDLAVFDADRALGNVRSLLDSGTPEPGGADWARFVRLKLPCRLGDEPPSAWREGYWEQFLSHALMDEGRALSSIQAWTGTLSLVSDLAPGPVMTPRQIMRAGGVSSERERELAGRAARRVLGVE
ncbi:serine/threonine-protein kinase [Desulfocurvus sp. DL9XJH121]